MKGLILAAGLAAAMPAMSLTGEWQSGHGPHAVQQQIASLCQTPFGTCEVPDAAIGTACACGTDAGTIIG